MLEALRVDEVQAIEIGPGCRRRDLPSLAGMRIWVVDIESGYEWPWLDRHETGEVVYVVSGSVIEDGCVHTAGTYLFFRPGSAHRPRTATGVRLFGFNPINGV